MTTFISHSPAETESLGERWGRAAQRGLIIGLSGELGAGKTQLVKGIARGLGLTNMAAGGCGCFIWICTGSKRAGKLCPPGWRNSCNRTA
jgi:hypothetical protein